MYQRIQLRITTPPFLIGLVLAVAWFAFLPKTQAVVPVPDGGYPGFNTAEGENALLSLDTSTGLANTGVGWSSLKSSVVASFNTGVGAGTLVLNSGDQNTAIGAAALLLNTTGSGNTAVGSTALLNNADGELNTANGVNALFSNTQGSLNTASGDNALRDNTTGSNNTATGHQALSSNTTATGNTANGSSTLRLNTTGEGNTASGQRALFNNTTGNNNVAIGLNALSSNTTASGNTASGEGALNDNTIGNFNTANGSAALLSNTEGTNNTAVGFHALANNTDGSFNTAFGDETLINLANGSGNVAIGPGAGASLTTGEGNIYIGNVGATTETATIRIGVPEHGAAFIGGISGTAVVGDTVVVDANGQLGTAASSGRFKKAIKPMDKTSEAILALKPVSFQYKSDSKGTLQFGLIAEEVAKVNPDLVIRDRKGEIYSVRYEAVNAMLLNEFLKEHKAFVEEQRKVQEQGATIARLEKQTEALTAGLQKVSARLEVNERAPQTVLNDQ